MDTIYTLVWTLILLGAYAQARKERAKRAEEELERSEELSTEFNVVRDLDAPEYNLAELREFHDQNRPS